MPHKDPEARRAYSRKWYSKNSKKVINKVGKNKQEIAKWFNDFKSTLKCSVCEENHPACIEFHHLDPEEKDFNVADLANNGYSKKRILAEVGKCVPLCSNCHKKVHWDIKVNSR